MAPETGANRFEGRIDDHRRGRRNHLAPQAKDLQAAIPQTALAAAFMRALRRWLTRHSGNSTSKKITLPTEVVSDDQLVQVLRAIFFGGKQ
jgi:hypothetical protein